MNELEWKSKEPVFVIGFPKSGNTWLARLLAEITDSNIAVSDLKDRVNSADNSLHRGGKYLIYKKHIVEDVSEILQYKRVYIVRDVRDVLPSWFFHCNRWASSNSYFKKTKLYNWYYDSEILKSNEILRGNPWSEFYVRLLHFLRFIILGKNNRIKIGNWSEHVTYWKQQPGVVIVRYEDLLKNTEREIKRIFDLLKIKIPDEIIAKSAKNQSFKTKKLKFIQNMDVKNATFLRNGKSGNWKNILSSPVIKKIESKHGHVMSELGYKMEDD